MNQKEIDAAEWRNRDNWTGPGLFAFYFSKRDSRTFVPKSSLYLGWTLNLGKPAGAKWLTALLVGIPALILAIFLTALILCCPARAEDGMAILELRDLMASVVSEMREGKGDTLVAHGHPAWVEQLGGKEKARAAFPALLGREINDLYAKGFTKVDYSAGEPRVIREGGTHTFALIPMTTTAEGKKGTITALGHMLAIRDERAKDRWRLIRLGLPEDEMRRLIPELPKDVKLPAPRKAVFKERAKE